MPTFLEIHAIQSLPPSNINRDDTGAPKSAIYGGTNRARVSSQAWKRATRLGFAGEIEPALRATRTKRVVRLLAEAMLVARGVFEPSEAELAEVAERADETLKAAGVKTKKNAVKKGQADPGTISFESEALVFVGGQQLASLAQVALAEGDVDAKAAKRAVDTGHGIDVALFGRMVASSPDLNVDAAVQVAHAISTHTVDPKGDYFTAVDDEKDTDEDAGAGMMGIIEFSSSTLYRYAAVSLDLLAQNLGDADVATEAVGAFLRSFVTSMPSGKKNSMAADTLPSAVLVTLRDSRPVSLVGHSSVGSR